MKKLALLFVLFIFGRGQASVQAGGEFIPKGITFPPYTDTAPQVRLQWDRFSLTQAKIPINPTTAVLGKTSMQVVAAVGYGVYNSVFVNSANPVGINSNNPIDDLEVQSDCRANMQLKAYKGEFLQMKHEVAEFEDREE